MLSDITNTTLPHALSWFGSLVAVKNASLIDTVWLFIEIFFDDHVHHTRECCNRWCPLSSLAGLAAPAMSFLNVVHH
jgi:hypothetical protein